VQVGSAAHRAVKGAIRYRPGVGSVALNIPHAQISPMGGLLLGLAKHICRDPYPSVSGSPFQCADEDTETWMS
jgi:hypothetical protein